MTGDEIKQTFPCSYRIAVMPKGTQLRMRGAYYEVADIGVPYVGLDRGRQCWMLDLVLIEIAPPVRKPAEKKPVERVAADAPMNTEMDERLKRCSPRAQRLFLDVIIPAIRRSRNGRILCLHFLHRFLEEPDYTEILRAVHELQRAGVIGSIWVQGRECLQLGRGRLSSAS